MQLDIVASASDRIAIRASLPRTFYSAPTRFFPSHGMEQHNLSGGQPLNHETSQVAKEDLRAALFHKRKTLSRTWPRTIQTGTLS